MMDGVSAMIDAREFRGRNAGALLPVDTLVTESRAALGQYSLERLMAYGLSHADATELRGRVNAGEAWRPAALDIAQAHKALICEHSTTPTKINLLYRSSAMTRMAQAMMIEDTGERRAIFLDAAYLFECAARLSGDRARDTISTSFGPIVSWRFSAVGRQVGAVLVIGGIEGWAMDFAELSSWLARRGLEVWAVDGPGQGESRLVYGHYLHRDWRTAYREVIAHIAAHVPGQPLGIIGSSVGGTLAFEIAAVEPAIAACCSNGGPQSGMTILGQQEAKVPKKRMMCGPHVANDAADLIWGNIDAITSGRQVECPVLIIHGQRDPLIPDEEMAQIFAGLASQNKTMITFSDGDHCVYNHADDKHGAICDWMVARLAEAGANHSSR
jgi:alpha-beta hydrolase superfamily lysophospholipase